MTTRILRHTLAAAPLALLFASGAAAQRPMAAGTGVYFETYSFGDAAAAGFKRVSLITIPLAAEIRATSWARLGVSSAFATGTAVSSDDTESTVSGLTDTSLQLTLPLKQDQFAIALAVTLPTGKSTYTTDEAQVAGVIAADLLPFRISNWGSGGSIDLSSQVARSFGGLNLGARVGFQAGQEFDLVEDGSFAYRPGNQIYGRLAADGSMGDSRLAAQITVHTFGDDQVNSQNLYKSGNRLQGILSYSAPAGRTGRLQAFVGALQRQHGTFIDGSEDTPAQTLFFLGTGLRRPFGRGIIMPALDLRLHRSSDGEGQGYIGGAGATLELPLAGGKALLLPSITARFGRLIVRDGVESGITGFDVGAGLRFGGIR